MGVMYKKCWLLWGITLLSQASFKSELYEIEWKTMAGAHTSLKIEQYNDNKKKATAYTAFS